MNEANHSMCDHATSRDRANGGRLLVWSVAWAAAVLLNSAASARDWFGGGPLPLVVATVSTLIGVGTLMAYRRLLRESDELRQKIEMQALAAAMGVGVVGGMAYTQFVRSLGAGEPHLAYVIAAMLVAYSLGVVVGRRRYA